MRLVANPPWVDRALTAHWDALYESVGAEMMPQVASVSRRGKRTFKELGCGHYGCVIPTNTENIVFKLTSDATEAAFVAAACSLGEFPEGMIRYYQIYEIPVTHRGRRVFALWREEASAIGFPLWIYEYEKVTDPYIRRSWRKLLDNLSEFQGHAAIVRLYITKAKDSAGAIRRLAAQKDFAWSFTRGARAANLRGAQRAAVSLQHCEDIAEIMEHTYASDAIGGAFSFYLEHGLLLADVHVQNVGVATRSPDDEYEDYHAVNVITDPGHMVPLQSRWLQISVPALEK